MNFAAKTYSVTEKLDLGFKPKDKEESAIPIPAAGDEPAAPNPARRAGRPRRRGPVALLPGNYTVRLTVDGQTYTQPAIVAPDPRGTPIDNADEGSMAND